MARRIRSIRSRTSGSGVRSRVGSPSVEGGRILRDGTPESSTLAGSSAAGCDTPPCASSSIGRGPTNLPRAFRRGISAPAEHRSQHLGSDGRQADETIEFPPAGSSRGNLVRLGSRSGRQDRRSAVASLNVQHRGPGAGSSGVGAWPSRARGNRSMPANGPRIGTPAEGSTGGSTGA